MIGLNGNYLFSISIGTFKDFLLERHLQEFTLIEEAGNVLPTFQMQFISGETIKRYLVEGSTLKIQFGGTLDTLRDIELCVTKVLDTKYGESARQYNVAGFLSAKEYITETAIRYYPNMSCLEAIQSDVDGVLKVVTNITKSNDTQNWIRHNINSKIFINDTCMHMNLPNSFPCFAITADKELIIKDVRKSLTGTKVHNWKLTPEAKAKYEIPYMGDYVDESEQGFINNWLGYNRTFLKRDLITGETSTYTPSTSMLLSMSNITGKDSAIGYRFGGQDLSSGNVHSQYSEAYNHNLLHLAVYSTIQLTVKTLGPYYNIKPLDVVMFVDKGVNGKSALESNSGLYLATKVSRSIKDRKLKTIVQISREAHNDIKVA